MNGTTRSVRVVHRELWEDLVGSSSFAYDSGYLQPGLAANFPWLSSIANNFETYVFEKFEVEYIPSCGTNTAGRVTIGVDYDADDPGALTKSELCSYEDTVSGPAWSNIKFTSTPGNLRRGDPRYTRYDISALSDGNWKLYDTGLLHVGTDGTSEAAKLGEVWLSYTIVLFTPQLNSFGASGTKGFAGTISALTPFGTSYELSPEGTNNASLSYEVRDDGGLQFRMPFEGLVTLVQQMNVGGTIGGLAIMPTTTCRSSSVCATSPMGSANTVALALVKVVADIGQILYLNWGLFTGSPAAGRARLCKGAYAALY